MFSKSTNAGALALLAAPVVVIAAVLIQPTLPGDASTQVTALASHHQAMITGMTLSIIAVVLLIAGTLWLALALAPRARGWPSPAPCSASSARRSSCSRTASPPRLPPSAIRTREPTSAASASE